MVLYATRYVMLIVFATSVLNAQSVDISQFYYRDYLDFGQNKGAFGLDSSNDSVNLVGKNGASITIPHTPNFQASSNNGSLTAIGRGFAVSANHVVNFTPEYDSLGTYRKFGLTTYKVSNNSVGEDISQPFGRDEKFARFDKYIIEGQVGMLDFTNSIDKENTTQESANLNAFKEALNALKNDNGEIYLYQTGSGVITLKNNYTNLADINRNENGETRGGGFGTLVQNSIKYESLVLPNQFCDSSMQNCAVRGIMFSYAPNLDFNNRITSGDSGSGIYAYDSTNNKWILLGVTSQETASNIAYIAAVSNKDFESHKSTFEQNIDLKITEPNASEWTLQNNTLTYQKRGDTPDKSYTFEDNKDIVFSGSGEMTINVAENIERNKEKIGSGGFVFVDSSAKTTYKFTNAGDYYFYGSGLDIGKNVEVEWHLRNKSGDFLHKIGQGTLIVKTDYTPTNGENLGYLKVGEGKVVLDSAKKAFEGIYITSGRATIDVKQAESLGAVLSNSADSSAKTYTLAQDKTSDMGFYFGTGGGTLDLQGNNLVLNTIAAQDANAIITNSNGGANLEIQGFGYDSSGNKTTNKANTIIHASFSDSTDSSANSASLNLTHKSDSKNENANLIFDGNINTSGSLKAEHTNITLQGHATTHATISDSATRDKIISAESGTSQAMLDSMDLSRPSTLQQSDWDTRTFNIKGGIDLKSANLNIGRNARVSSDISADSTSKIVLGNITHFIDKNDGKNVSGSGFSYNQSVESGTISDSEAVNKSISYNGKITLNGGKVESSIYDFNAKLDLKSNATINADYLVLTSANASEIKLADSAKATIQTLVVKNLNNLDAFNPIANGASGASFAVQKGFMFDNATFDLSKLDSSTSFTKPSSYDISAKNNSTISANDINITNAQNALISIDSSSKLTLKNNGEIKAQNSTLTLALDSAQSLNLNASGTSKISLQTLSESSQDSNIALFSGKIIASDSSVIDSTALESISASVDLKNSARLNAKNITLDSSFNSISLESSASLSADSIIAKSLNSLNLNIADSAKVDVKSFIFDGGTISNLSALVGDSIALKNNANITLLNTTLTNTTKTIELESSAKINFANLTLDSAKLYLDANASHTQSFGNISLQNSASLYINTFDTSTMSANLSSSDSASSVIFDTLHATNTTSIGANSTISTLLSLQNVGANNAQTSADSTLLTLNFDKNLTLSQNAKINIAFNDSVKKGGGVELDTYYTIAKANYLSDNRTNKLINFSFAEGVEALYVVSKIENNALIAKFLESNPKSFNELNKHISAPLSDVLKALLEHNPNDYSIDVAVNSEDYATLEQTLSAHNSTMESLSEQANATLATQMLYSTDSTINTRLTQARFQSFRAQRQEHLSKVRLAMSDKALESRLNSHTRSDYISYNHYLARDIMLSATSKPKNSAWLSVNGGVLNGKSQSLSFYGSNLGVDRALGDTIIGVMGSVGSSNFRQESATNTARIYGGGLYLNSIFGKNELQMSLNVAHSSIDRQFDNLNAKSSAFSGFLSNYYKYIIDVKRSENAYHTLKPLLFVGLGFNNISAWSNERFKSEASSDKFAHIGAGIEYSVMSSNALYSIGIIGFQKLHSLKEARLSFTNANTMINYTMQNDAFALSMHIIGTHYLGNRLSIEYGVYANRDSLGYVGIKGDIKCGFRF